MKRTFFFDIDGTLIDCNQNIYSIPQTTRDSLDKLKANGHDVFLATGRCKCFITPGVFDYPFSGYVTCNGGCVEYQGECVSKDIISGEAIKATMELCEECDLNYYFESNDYIYVRDAKDERHIEFAKNWGMKDETIIDDFNYNEIETYIGMIVVNGHDDIPVVVDRLSKYFDVQRHQSDFSFDLTLKGVSKAKGIQALTKKLNLDIKNTIAFGDGRNDIEMLETVGCGVAMGNAVVEAKAIANQICDSVSNDGITLWLKDNNYID